MKKIEYSKEALDKLVDIKDKIALDYGEKVSDKVILRIFESINRLEIFENSGVKLSSVLDVKCEYRYIYAEKNYIFYRITDESIKIITILNEKQDFMQCSGILKLIHLVR